MKVAYSFSVLRYIHDPVTQEFVNIGVAVFSAATFVASPLWGRMSPS